MIQKLFDSLSCTDTEDYQYRFYDATIIIEYYLYLTVVYEHKFGTY